MLKTYKQLKSAGLMPYSKGLRRSRYALEQ
jgi:hypothetical protein